MMQMPMVVKARPSDCKHCAHRLDWHYTIINPHGVPCAKIGAADKRCICPGYEGINGCGLPPTDWIKQDIAETSKAVISMLKELP